MVWPRSRPPARTPTDDGPFLPLKSDRAALNLRGMVVMACAVRAYGSRRPGGRLDRNGGCFPRAGFMLLEQGVGNWRCCSARPGSSTHRLIRYPRHDPAEHLYVFWCAPRASGRTLLGPRRSSRILIPIDAFLSYRARRASGVVRDRVSAVFFAARVRDDVSRQRDRHDNRFELGARCRPLTEALR